MTEEETKLVNKLAADEIRLAEQLEALLTWLSTDEDGKPVDKVEPINKQRLDDMLLDIDTKLGGYINDVLCDQRFRELEGVWRAIADLEAATDFAKNIVISLLDVTKQELNDDVSANVADWTNSELFSILYAREYDQHGGSPYGAIIGLFSFKGTDDDLGFLKGMASICKKSHVPFVASASSEVFGKADFAELVQLREVDGELSQGWRMFRKQEESAYVGLTLPRYIVRAPYRDYRLSDAGMRLSERKTPVEVDDDATAAAKANNPARIADDYVWGSSALLFAQNLVRSFRDSGWCQYIRGVQSGGTIKELAVLPRDPVTDEVGSSVEVVIPDSLEFSLAKAGFIPLVWEKGTSRATFFSAQSMKLARDGALALTSQDAHYAENEQLTTNLSYTYTICRLAHYLKVMMRGNIGSTADAAYVKSQIDAWISRYVTTVINPDDLTLRYYPFKAYASTVDKVPGRAGWFDCSLTVQPHIQFEGIDITLKVDARLAD